VKGTLLIDRLGLGCVDLDRRFANRAGDIGEYINRFGYEAYARENVETYRLVGHEEHGAPVVAVSSGFMTYPEHIYPDYARLCREVVQSPVTFVLVPSLNRERCVAETVNRQLSRRFARSAAREEAVIRERFPIYVSLPVRKIETMRSLATIVDEIVECATWMPLLLASTLRCAGRPEVKL